MCIAIFGAVLSAAGSVMGGIAANNAAKAQAKAYDRQAIMERNAGAYQSARQREGLDRLIGKQANNFAASGIGVSGSAVDVLESSRQQGELDVQATLYGANVRADNLRIQADIERAKGKDAMAAGFIGGLSGLVGGLGRTNLGGSFF